MSHPRYAASHRRAVRRRRAEAAPPVAPFVGPRRLPDRTWVERLVRAYTSGDGALTEALVDWICATGDCLLHAAYEVRKARGLPATCYGACCAPDAPRTPFGGVQMNPDARWR